MLYKYTREKGYAIDVFYYFLMLLKYAGENENSFSPFYFFL